MGLRIERYNKTKQLRIMSSAHANKENKKGYTIIASDKMLSYLRKNGRKDYLDFDLQLQTNYGFVYYLKSKEVVFVPNNFKNDAILFENKKNYQKTIDSDFFPIENPEQNLYDIELDRIRSINKQIEFYQNHLNTVLNFQFKTVDVDTAQAYMKKIIGRKIKKLTTETDLVALIAIIGEIMRKRIKGKWLLEKWYGMYNPYYMPRILDTSKKIIHINDYVLTSVKWNNANVEQQLKRTEGILTLKKTRMHHECIILK